MLLAGREKRKINNTINLCILTAIILVLALRLLYLSQYSPIWIDEQASINAACGDSSLNALPPAVLQQKLHAYKQAGILGEKIFASNLANDRGNALLFDYLLSCWFLLFGCSFLSVKGISMLLFFLVILIIMYMNRNKPATSGFLLLLLVVHPLLYRYSLECRTYMLATFVTVAATAVVFKFKETGQLKLLPFYFLLAGISLFCHYLVAPVLAWHFFLLLTFSSRKEKTNILICYFFFAFFLLFALYVLNEKTGFIGELQTANHNISQNAGKVKGNPNQTAGIGSIGRGLFQVILLMFGLSLQSFLQIRFFAILIIPVLWIVYLASKVLSRDQFWTYMLLFIIHIVYMVIVSVLSGNNIIFQINYSVFMLPYYLMFVAVTLTALKAASIKIGLQVLVTVVALTDCIGYILAAR